jgi:hypothetical protein
VIGLAEWVKGKKTVSCPFGKKESEKFGFDITKADKIFDLLLQQGQIKLSQFHTILSAEKIKRMKYCKWHNATSHDTNNCKIFRQQIQLASEQGKLKFKTPTKAEKSMKIDQHPFPTNTVEVFSKGMSRVVDGVYEYPISFGLASGQVLCRSQGTLLPSSVNPRYRICGTNV